MLLPCRRVAVFAAAIGTALLFAPSVRAQVYRYPQKQVINLPTFKTTGEYVGMQGSYMKCILDGTPVLVQFVNQKSKVKVTGTATSDFLAPGMYVRFTGTFDRHGKGTDPIKDFVIFTPDADNQIGAIEAGGGSSSLFSDPTPTTTTKEKKGPQPQTSTYTVSGRITTLHRDQMMVAAGGKMKYRFQVAPDATVKLDSSDPSWASQGDKVTISGAKLGNNRVVGVDVSIELSKPLEPKKKTHGYHAAEKSTPATIDKLSTDKTSTDKPTTDKSTDKSPPTDKPADPNAAPGTAAGK
jgi:hypothetical protein